MEKKLTLELVSDQDVLDIEELPMFQINEGPSWFSVALEQMDEAGNEAIGNVLLDEENFPSLDDETTKS